MATDLLKSAAAHESWAATENRTARTAPARAALEQKFLDQANGDPVRAAHLRKAYFLRLAAKSAEARRRTREVAEMASAAGVDVTELDAQGGGADAA